MPDAEKTRCWMLDAKKIDAGCLILDAGCQMSKRQMPDAGCLMLEKSFYPVSSDQYPVSPVSGIQYQ